MTYNYNKEQHTAKIKAGLETAKKKGKKLGRPKGGKIKGEERALYLYYNNNYRVEHKYTKAKVTYSDIAKYAGVSLSTVQKIINKHKKNDRN